jgi:aspartate/tyrosine/aromatic aminotransferase
VLQRRRQTAQHEKQSEKRKSGVSTSARQVFGPMADAGARVYSRARDLPKLIALWPQELDDMSHAGRLRVLAKLRSALRAERRRALAGHWSYDLNRHLGLLSAYKGELAGLRANRRNIQPNCTRRDSGFDCG